MTPYDLLGARPDMDGDRIKRLFRERLRRVHPDRNPDLPRAEELTRELIAAYSLLSDPERPRANVRMSVRAIE